MCYTFGCPRVGNRAFARLFHAPLERGLVEVYRVVNGADIVARLPRHGNAIAQLLDYEHCGKTVLVSEGNERAGASVSAPLGSAPMTVETGGIGGEDEKGGQCWVEGETDDQTCPLRDGTPLVDPLADGALLFEALREGVRQRSALATVDKLLQVTPQDVTQLLGLDSRFVEAELQMVKALSTGAAITHHLEPSYYAAMVRAAKGEGHISTSRTRVAASSEPPGAESTSAAGKGEAQATREELRSMLEAAGIRITPP